MLMFALKLNSPTIELSHVVVHGQARSNKGNTGHMWLDN